MPNSKTKKITYYDVVAALSWASGLTLIDFHIKNIWPADDIESFQEHNGFLTDFIATREPRNGGWLTERIIQAHNKEMEQFEL